MIELKKILMPTDFSEHSERAFHMAADMASRFRAELHIVHVVEDMAVMMGETAYVPVSTQQLIAASIEKIKKLSSLAPDNVSVITQTLEGHPFVEIIRYAKDKAINLIVMGTHGRGAIAHMLMGNVAEKVVRKAPCPVLTVRDANHEFVHP